MAECRKAFAGEVAPEDFRNGCRTARWTWWAYMDVPSELVEAWDLLSHPPTRTRTRARVESFFTNAADQVMANHDQLTNMSPGLWASLIRTGRVIGEPAYIHASMERLRQLMANRFFYDGVWMDGAPSYQS